MPSGALPDANKLDPEESSEEALAYRVCQFL